MAIKILLLHKPLQVCMIVLDFELLLSSFEVVVPHLQGLDYAQHFFINDGVILFFWAHGMESIGNQVLVIFFED